MKLFVASAVFIAMCGGQGAMAQPPSVDALVQDLPLQPSAAENPQPVAAPSVTQEVTEPNPDPPLDLEALSDLRGGETYPTQISNQNLDAVNSGNSVTADTVGSGAVNLNSNAFNGYDGVGNFVINTGHNNNLMGSISVNVMVTPQ